MYSNNSDKNISFKQFNKTNNFYLQIIQAKNQRYCFDLMLGYGFGSKLQIFILTFCTYVSVHSLRTAYSYSKHHIAIAIQSDKSMLGLIDTCFLLSLGIGFLYHAIVPDKKPVQNLVIALLSCSLTYAIIPFAIDHYFNSLQTLLVLMSLNGFIQSFTWTNLLVIVNSRWDKNRDSTALGFWSTNANVGNILGFIICEQVHVLNLPWEDQMYAAAFVTFVMGLLIFWRIKQVQVKAKPRPSSQSVQQIRQKKLSIFELLSQQQVLLVTGTLSCVKSVIYGIMLWLPMYFHNIGLADYSTYIPITYDIFCVLGSVGLGFLFSKVQVKAFLLMPLMVVLVLCFYALKYFNITVSGYFVLIAIVGMCLGGSFNTIVGLSTIQLTKSVPEEQRLKSLSFYSAVTMAMANFVTALTQLLIGFVVGKQQSRIFIIFIVYSALAFVGFVLSALSQMKQIKEIQSQKKNK